MCNHQALYQMCNQTLRVDQAVSYLTAKVDFFKAKFGRNTYSIKAALGRNLRLV